VAPQLLDNWAGESHTALDSRVAAWLRLHKGLGHGVEGGVRTLHYDGQCCHLQGECEWIACQDIVLVTLEDGDVDGAAAGLYVGAPAPVALPREIVANGTYIAIFQSLGTNRSALALGRATDGWYCFRALSARAHLVLAGEFWQPPRTAAPSYVVQTIRDANQSVISTIKLPLPRGPVEVRLALWQSVTFEKHADAQLRERNPRHSP
jgi:hypothetical protein